VSPPRFARPCPRTVHENRDSARFGVPWTRSSHHGWHRVMDSSRRLTRLSKRAIKAAQVIESRASLLEFTGSASSSPSSPSIIKHPALPGRKALLSELAARLAQIATNSTD
jgi:hypothetical protein